MGKAEAGDRGTGTRVHGSEGGGAEGGGQRRVEERAIGVGVSGLRDRWVSRDHRVGWRRRRKRRPAEKNMEFLTVFRA